MNRREFLESGIATTAVFSLSGFTLLPRRAAAERLSRHVVAEPYDKPMIDGSTVPTWRFRDLSGPGPGSLEAGFAIVEGDRLVLDLTNDLPRAFRFRVPGLLEDGPRILPGEVARVELAVRAAGTYLFFGDLEDGLGLAMGLAGPMIVAPPGEPMRFDSDSPQFDRQYTLMLSSLDDRVADPPPETPFEATEYEPNYFFVNGLSYPETLEDPNTRVTTAVGERVGLRLVNADLLAHPMHFHGYHVQVLRRDREVVTAVVDKDTVLVEPGQCVDVLLSVDQPGKFPLHTHFVPGVTANGVYLNPVGGALVLMEAN